MADTPVLARVQIRVWTTGRAMGGSAWSFIKPALLMLYWRVKAIRVFVLTHTAIRFWAITSFAWVVLQFDFIPLINAREI